MTPAAPVAIVAGSGFNLFPLLDTRTQETPFTQIPGLKATAVQGHQGTFIQGQCGPHPIILQSGRLHFYEGHDYPTVTSTLPILHQMGARTILFTNAAGGLDPSLEPGTLISVTQIHLWPCQRWPGHPKTLQPDITLSAANFQGPYIWVHGPSYETPAEIQALTTMKAAAVGMSTAPELAACQALGMKAAVISCITNNCLDPQILTHNHVIQTAEKSSEKLCQLIRKSLPELARH